MAGSLEADEEVPHAGVVGKVNEGEERFDVFSKGVEIQPNQMGDVQPALEIDRRVDGKRPLSSSGMVILDFHCLHSIL